MIKSCLAAAAAFALISATAFAATFTVTNTGDAGVGSLRAAITGANAATGADTVNFAVGVSGAIVLASSLPPIAQSLVISGPGAGVLSIDGNQLYQIFVLDSATNNQTFAVAGLTLERGFGSDGGALLVELGETLTLTDMVFDSNVANNGGGAITNAGITLCQRCTLTNNSVVAGSGGALQQENAGSFIFEDSTIEDNFVGSYSGGAIESAGVLTIRRSILRGNYTGINGGGGGIQSFSNGNLTIVDSLLHDNTTGGNGGGAIDNSRNMTLINVTISANTDAPTGYAGAMYISGTGTSVIRNCTIHDNVAATSASAIYRSGTAGLTITNTVISGGGPAPLCFGVTGAHSLGNNIDSGTSCAFAATGDQSNTNPLLGALQNNGGPTPTHLPGAGSPAINNGNSAVCPTGDQRGAPRGGTVCDVGAVELACGNTFVEAPETCDDGNLQAGDGCSATCQVESVAPTGPTGASGASGTSGPSGGAGTPMPGPSGGTGLPSDGPAAGKAGCGCRSSADAGVVTLMCLIVGLAVRRRPKVR